MVFEYCKFKYGFLNSSSVDKIMWLSPSTTNVSTYSGAFSIISSKFLKVICESSFEWIISAGLPFSFLIWFLGLNEKELKPYFKPVYNFTNGFCNFA